MFASKTVSLALIEIYSELFNHVQQTMKKGHTTTQTGLSSKLSMYIGISENRSTKQNITDKLD